MSHEGQSLDLVGNIDGFNEVALSSLNTCSETASPRFSPTPSRSRFSARGDRGADDSENAAELYEDMVRRLHYTAHGGREEPMRVLRFAVPVLATIPLAGCELVGDIFKAGIWVGVIFVVLIIAMVGVIATKIRS